MSALTKVFIVLLVVLSILLPSAMVVFVNRTEDWRAANNMNKTALALANQKLIDTQAALATAVNVKEQSRQQFQEQVDAKSKLIDIANQQILDLKSQLTSKDAQIASAQSGLRSAQAALEVAQGNQGKLQTTLLATRVDADKVQTQLTEANITISDQANKIQVLQRQVRNLNEELAGAKEDAEKATPASSTSQGGPAGSSEGPVLPPQPAVASLNGIVRATQTIGGIKYATISIGSAETVKKGMRFSILGGNKNDQFMGYVTITSVEPHEAVGRVEGPRVTEVAAQNVIVARL